MGLKILKLKKDNKPKQNVVSISVYLCFGGGVEGPYDLPQLRDMYHNGQLPPETLCNFGTGDWLRLYDMPLMNLIRENSAPSQSAAPEQQESVAAAPTAITPSPASNVENVDDEGTLLDDFMVPKTDAYINDDSPVITCPHCWKEFHLTEANYISCHPSLTGDSVLGETAQTRFLPTKFNAQGYAIDAGGMVCRDMACPRCHLKIPEILLEEKIDVLSIVGSPASGKSYYITALTNMLRKNLPEYFDYSFTDADVNMNYMLNHYEDLLFHNNSDDEVALPKTELEGNNFSTPVKLHGFTVNLPLPYIFTLRKIHDSTTSGNGKGLMHNVVMYDNAGEHFEAGRDSVANLATMHLINSSLIMFLFDPFKDSKAVRDCSTDDPEANVAFRSINQAQILREMVNRIRKYRGMASFEKSDKILTVLVPKYDAWSNSFPLDLKEVPFIHLNKETFTCSLDFTIIKLASYCMRQWLLARAPEIVSEAEAFFRTVYFLPVSALGCCPNYDATKNMIGIRPGDISPIWVDVPIYIYLWKCGLVPAVRTVLPETAEEVKGSFRDDSFFFLDEKSGRPQSVPSLYWGEVVYDVSMRKYLRFPEKPAETKGGTAAPGAADSFWN